MVKPLYISFFTPDYAQVANRLLKSLQKFQLEFCMCPITDRGLWINNCALKPLFILQQMNENPNQPLVWVDADAEIMQLPNLPGKFSNVDAAVCEYSWRRGKKLETLSGTVLINPTSGGRRLVDLWASSQDGTDKWDQISLGQAVATARQEGVTVGNLPVDYCFIFDFHQAEHPEIQPYITHYQHSRTTRHKK